MSDRKTLNQKVVLWARGKVGKKVGAGECWDLGESSLEHAGALTSNDLGPVGDDTDYVWGDAIAIKEVQPGDILQFRDHEINTTTVTELVFTDGSTYTQKTSSTMTVTRPHHTAIANGMLNRNGTLSVLEQQHGQAVHNSTLSTRSFGPTVTKSVEKRANPSTKKKGLANVTTTVTVVVSGELWVYRPKAK